MLELCESLISQSKVKLGMRIAQVSHGFDCGGSMAVMAALCLELSKRGHEVDAICIDQPSGSSHEALSIDRLRAQGVDVHFLGRKRGHAGVGAAARLWHLTQQRRYDVVHSHLPMPDAITGLVRRSQIHPFTHVVTVHNTREPRSGPLTWLASGANVVYCSEAVSRQNPLPGVSYTVIPNGIPQDGYAGFDDARGQVCQQLGLDPQGPIVIGVGRLCPQKAYHTALDALAILKYSGRAPDLQYLLCGEGEARAQLEFQTRQLGIEGAVHFLGARTDIQRLLGASDVFLSTSLYEGMPLSVLEALNAGLSCVLSDIPEHYELAGTMPGCQFAPHAPESVASALEAALAQKMSRAALRESRAPLLRKHSAEQSADSYLMLYDKCCRSRFVSELQCS